MKLLNHVFLLGLVNLLKSFLKLACHNLNDLSFHLNTITNLLSIIFCAGSKNDVV